MKPGKVLCCRFLFAFVGLDCAQNLAKYVPMTARGNVPMTARGNVPMTVRGNVPMTARENVLMTARGYEFYLRVLFVFLTRERSERVRDITSTRR